ncbi:Uncharacterised protein [Candidatus Anstonella stagnisolia]|nr:Uncharacterised protein [Candidatus Anstonella stagnisolia]
MKNYTIALVLAVLLFGCISVATKQSTPASGCSGRFDEELNKCVQYSDSVFSSASLYEGKYVCFWGTLATQKLLTMPSTKSPRISVHVSWGANSPPSIGNCTKALANVCGTFSSANFEYYQLLDAQAIGLDKEGCTASPSEQAQQQSPQTQPAPNSPPSVPSDPQGNNPPAPPAGNSTATNSPSTSPDPNADMPPPLPTDSSGDMPPPPPSN